MVDMNWDLQFLNYHFNIITCLFLELQNINEWSFNTLVNYICTIDDYSTTAVTEHYFDVVLMFFKLLFIAIFMCEYGHYKLTTCY